MSLYAVGFLVAITMIAAIWFGYVAPSERRYHDKKLEMLQERIAKRKQFLDESKASRNNVEIESGNDNKSVRPQTDDLQDL